MEHRDDLDREDSESIENSNIEETLESISSDSFEDYLAGKAETCAPDIIAELRSNVQAAMPTQSETGMPRAATADIAEGESTGETNSPAGETRSTLGSVPVPGAVDELETKLTLHTHPIIGSYYTETAQPIVYDEELKAMFFDSKGEAVSTMTAEAVVELTHKLERAVQMIRMKQMGLRVALEELLQARTWKEREQIMELDRKHRAKVNKRQSEKTEKAGKAGSSAKGSIAAAGRGKTKGMKTADTLKSLMMDKAATIKTLQGQNLWDSVTEAHVEKLYGGAK